MIGVPFLRQAHLKPLIKSLTGISLGPVALGKF